MSPGDRPRGRRYPRLVLLAAAALALFGTVLTLHLGKGRGDPVDTTPAATGPAPAWGVLGGSCDAERVVALRDGGVRLVELGVVWGDLEPRPGQFDGAYLRELHERIGRCRDAGLGVVLTPGFHMAPEWVTRLPGASYRDQQGRSGPVHVPNLVFSTAARQAATEYLTRLATEFPLDGFAAIRVGTSEAGELGYPGRVFGTPGNSFWAFDVAAQSGEGLPDGITGSPLPGWIPGQRAWNGGNVSTADTRRWYDWYAESAARTIVWEIDVLRSLGFHGTVHMPLAGRGALPDDLAEATVAAFDGTADRDGSLERGLFYPDQLALIADATANDPRAPGAVAADVTGVGDATAVTARGLDPPQDTCLASDATRALRSMPGAELWSATRWTVANARAGGLRVVGENPGPPSAPGTGGDDLSDELADQLVHARRYAADCGLEVLFFAFEDNLFAPGSGVRVEDLTPWVAR